MWIESATFCFEQRGLSPVVSCCLDLLHSFQDAAVIALFKAICPVWEQSCCLIYMQRRHTGVSTFVQVNQVKKALGRIKEVQANLSEALSEQEAVAEIEAAKAQEFENKVIVCSENLAQMLPDGQKPNLSSVETVSEMTDDDAKELEFRCSPQ